MESTQSLLPSLNLRIKRALSSTENDNKEETSDKIRCRNLGCDKLARLNHYEADDHAKFDEESHTYHINLHDEWIRVERSTTSLVHSLFEPFDAVGIINKSYARWERTPSSPYFAFISSRKNDGFLESDIKTQLAQQWEN